MSITPSLGKKTIFQGTHKLMKSNQSVPDTASCPCHSGRPYILCCGPLLAGDLVALTAEALMRSRYTAYVSRDIAYLLRSWHPTTRPDQINPDVIPEWQGLLIVRTEQGAETDNEGIVEFQATAVSLNKAWQLHEVRRFLKEDGQWLYVDGDIKDDSSVVDKKVPKIGRNDPCHCGSGKKYKKCCGC